MKFERTAVSIPMMMNALYGMRNPMNSWSKSDSEVKSDCGLKESIIIGPNDLKLAQTLIKAGSVHAKFMRQIPVSVQITAPAYWWPEMDQYKVGTATDSTSKMHKLLSKPITQECFEDEIEPNIVSYLETIRCTAVEFQKSGDTETARKCWQKLLAHLPHSWLQTRMWSANYEVLRNIYFQRKNHKLDQWKVDFVNWIKTLPYAEELIMVEK